MLFSSPFVTIYCLVLAAFAGAAAASFMNCMAWRKVHGESVLKGRSHCDDCGHVLGALDLIPIAGFLIRKGKCHYCGKKLSYRHFIYEVLGAVVFVTILLRQDLTLGALEGVIFASILMGTAFADIEDYVIPDSFIIVGIGIRIVFILISGDILQVGLDSLIGGIGIALILLIIVLISEKLMKREAMGGGDIKLIAMIGLYLGWKRNILMIFMACIIGIIMGMATQKRREQDESLEDKKIFPWGPSLAIAAWLTLLFGDGIINGYLSLF